MDAARIESRAVFKVVAIVAGRVGVALLLEHVVVEVRTTIRWLVAAIFLALALSPLVDLVERIRIRGRSLPRWLAILVAYVLFLVALRLPRPARDPADRARGRGARLAAARPTSRTSRTGPNNNEQFHELNEKYDLTAAAQRAGRAAARRARRRRRRGSRTSPSACSRTWSRRSPSSPSPSSCCSTAPALFERVTPRLREPDRERARRVGTRIAADRALLRHGQPAARDRRRPLHLARRSRSRASTSRCRWRSWSAFLDLVPLIGLTIGGLAGRGRRRAARLPDALIVWVVALPRLPAAPGPGDPAADLRGAVQVNPVVAIVACSPAPSSPASSARCSRSRSPPRSA